VRINYQRISLLHNLSRKCRKIVKFVSITHSERNIWNGPIVATAISREKRKPVEGNGCLTYRAYLVCPGNLWRFNAHSDNILDVSWSSWDFDSKVVWTISLQRTHLSSRKGSCGEAKCYRRDGRQSAWNFHSQLQEIWAESQSRVEDTGASSGENSTETTAVVTVQTATSKKCYDNNLYYFEIIQHFGFAYIFVWVRKLDFYRLTETKNWGGRNEIVEAFGMPHP
jgi:hypothetical protein